MTPQAPGSIRQQNLQIMDLDAFGINGSRLCYAYSKGPWIDPSAKFEKLGDLEAFGLNGSRLCDSPGPWLDPLAKLAIFGPHGILTTRLQF